MQSSGFDDTVGGDLPFGYISVNGIVAMTMTLDPSASHRGFNMVELVLDNCTAINAHQFDTYGVAAAGDAMIAYVSTLPVSTVVIGVTFDDANSQLSSQVKTSLLGFGIDATHLQFRGKLTFVAQIGHPSGTMMRVAPPGGEHLELTATVQHNIGEIVVEEKNLLAFTVKPSKHDVVLM